MLGRRPGDKPARAGQHVAVEIEELGPATEPEAVELILREQPHFVRPEVTMLFDDATAPGRHVSGVRRDGALVAIGYLATLAWSPPSHATLRVVTARAVRGEGLGARLHHHLLQRVGQGTEQLRTVTFDDDPEANAVAEHWGYRALQRSITSTIEVTGSQPPALPPGVSVSAYDTIDPEDREAVAELLDVSQTNPERDHTGALTLEDLSAQQQGDRPLFVVVRVDGAPAALSIGVHHGPEGYLAYTGVAPGHRGRGLAKVAKLAIQHQAATRGVRVLGTENQEHNDGIRRVNRELGWQERFGTWRRARPWPS